MVVVYIFAQAQSLSEIVWKHEVSQASVSRFQNSSLFSFSNYLFIYLFIFGCVGSSLPRACFL